MRPRDFCAGMILLVAGCGGEEADVGRQTRAVASDRETRPVATAEPARDETRHRTRIVTAEARSSSATAPAEVDPAREWLNVLCDRQGTYDERQEAARALGRLGKRTLPLLVPFLDDPAVGRWALMAIVSMGADAEAAVPSIVNLLANDTAGATYDLAQNALVEIGAPAVRHVVAASKDESAVVRRRAAEVLGRMGCEDEYGPLGTRTDATAAVAPEQRGIDTGLALPALVDLLRDPVAEVRAAAANAIGRFGASAGPCVEALTAALSDTDGVARVAAIAALGRTGPSAAVAVPRLLELALREPAWTPHVIWGLGELAPDRLAEMLGGDDQRLRLEIAKWAEDHESKGPALEAAWERALEDPDAEIRAAAIRSTTQAETAPGVVSKLRSCLGFPDTLVRQRAAEALGDVASPSDDLVRDLVRSMSDPNSQVRENAAESLGRLVAAPEISIPGLVAALGDPDPPVASAAATSIARWGSAARDAVPDLRRALGRDEAWVQFRAAEALCAIEPSSEAVAAVSGFLRHGNSSIRKQAVLTLGATGRLDVIPELVTRLDDGDRDIRVTAAKTLASFGTAAVSAAETLERMTTSRDASIVTAAREALAVIRPR